MLQADGRTRPVQAAASLLRCCLYEALVDRLLQPFGQQAHMGLLEHAGMATRDVDHADATGAPSAPAECGIRKKLDERCIQPDAGRGAKEHQPSLELPGGPVSARGIAIGS